jgi:hypothetical protein
MREEVKKMGKTHDSSFEQRIWIWCFGEDLVHVKERILRNL